MVSPERLMALERLWVFLARDRSPTPERLFDPFEAVVAAYSEPHRAYHTLGHLGEVLRVVTKLLPPATLPPELLFAAWFHDFAYDPRATDNEERSADAARVWLADFATDEELSRIKRLILATKSHDPAGDPEAVILVDADLAILAAAPNRYAAYRDAIRREYAHLSGGEFRTGRARFIEKMLARPAIFYHPSMQSEGEAVARANLAAELADLENGRIVPAGSGLKPSND